MLKNRENKENITEFIQKSYLPLLPLMQEWAALSDLRERERERERSAVFRVVTRFLHCLLLII